MTERQLFLQNIAQTSDFPLALEIEKAEGIYLFDKKGKKYMDLISGIGVSNVGHRHPNIVAAIKAQVDKYLHLMVYGEYIQSPQVQLAIELLKLVEIQDSRSEIGDSRSEIQDSRLEIRDLRNISSPEPKTENPEPRTQNQEPRTKNPEHKNNIYFTNSGAEAVEGAMKLAKRYTQRTEIIACHNSYHGSTQGALSLGEEHFRRNFRPLLPSIKKISRNNFDDLDKITSKTAAVFFEPIGGESGVQVADNQYIKQLRAKCIETQTLLVFDEVQSGFGRTGKFWAYEHFDVKPDILLCAKGMGGGMPIGAFIASQEVMSVLKSNPILGHITTFGGHPVSCAASLATLRTILEENLMNELEQKSQLFKSLLVHPKIKEVRGKGLMLAAEFESFEVLKPIIDRCIEHGVITDWFLYCDNSMRIAPPLTITFDEISLACEVIISLIE